MWEAVRVSGYCWAKGFAGNFRLSDSFPRHPFAVALRLCLNFICGTWVPYAHVSMTPKVILLSLALRLPDDVTTALIPTIGPKKSIAIWGPALQGQLQLGHIVTRLIIVSFCLVDSVERSSFSSSRCFLNASDYPSGIRQQSFFSLICRERDTCQY